MRHPKFPRPKEPAVDKNPFRGRASEPQEILSFEQARPLLPVPILPGYSEWEAMYWRAWELAWEHLYRPPQGSGLVANYINSDPSDSIFMWDSAFMIHFGFYGRRAFDFMGTLNNFYARQHADGFICREIDAKTGLDMYSPFDPDGTGPNIFAWAEWRHYRVTGDVERLNAVFWPLLALHRWFRANRTWRNGLYWATGLSSGMDNQERIPGGRHHHRHWIWMDASVQAALNCLALQQMALGIGETELADRLATERQALHTEINVQLWHGDAKFYQDVDPNGRFSPHKSIAAYWALLDENLVPEKRLEPFVQHLREPAVFLRTHRSPSLSADSPGYDFRSGDFWRGGVWSPTTFMLLKGLRTVNQHKLANVISVNHLNCVAQVLRETGTFWDYYAPDEIRPGEGARRDFVGWTGLTAVSVLLEDAIGLMTDWPQRRVMWDRRLAGTGHYGVRNYPLGTDHTLDLIGDDEKVFVTTDVAFTLVLRSEEMSLQTAISPGTTEISLK